jgi:hypothetical protein
MSVTIAIAHPDSPKEVNLWCTINRSYEDGKIDFYVINGAWNGILYPDGSMKVKETGTIFPAIKVWEGTVDRDHAGDYNTAIPWINSVLNTPKEELEEVIGYIMKDES